MEFMMAPGPAHCRAGAKSQRLAIFYRVPKIMSNYSRRILCAIVCLLGSVCFAQTPAVRNAGVFSNTQGGHKHDKIQCSSRRCGDQHYCFAQARLIAQLTSDRFDDLFGREALARKTRRTIDSKDALKREIQKIRARGYAVDDEECGLGVRCLASPICDREGRAVAAIGVAGTTAQVNRHDLEKLGNLAKNAAVKISRNLGFVV